MTATLIALAVVGLLVAGVGWACWRLAFEIARFEDWDYPPVKAKREHWK